MSVFGSSETSRIVSCTQNKNIKAWFFINCTNFSRHNILENIKNNKFVILGKCYNRKYYNRKYFGKKRIKVEKNDGNNFQLFQLFNLIMSI